MGFPLHGCTVRVERKFNFDGPHVLKLSAHSSEESWVISLQIVKLQNSYQLKLKITVACACYVPSLICLSRLTCFFKFLLFINNLYTVHYRKLNLFLVFYSYMLLYIISHQLKKKYDINFQCRGIYVI